jgi:hypothetical protein
MIILFLRQLFNITDSDPVRFHYVETKLIETTILLPINGTRDDQFCYKGVFYHVQVRAEASTGQKKVLWSFVFDAV